MNLAEYLKDIFNTECLIYDIEYTQTGFAVDKYRSKIITNHTNGETISYRTYRFIGRDYPKDLSMEIKALRKKGYKDIGVLYPNELVSQIICSNYLLTLKLSLMERNCQLIEKIYDTIYTKDDIKIRTFIIYVDIKTGIVYQMNMGIIGSYNQKNINLLNEYNYINYKDSNFYNSNQINNHKNILNLTHKKN